MPNRERLIELAVWLGGEKAKQDLGLPSEWEQGVWLNPLGIEVNGTAKFGCGTTCCAAGRTAIVAGGMPVFRVYDCGENEFRGLKRWEELTEEERRAATSENGCTTTDDEEVDVCAEPNDSEMAFKKEDGSFEIIPVDDFAKEYLELDEEEAHDLFWGFNDYDAIINVIYTLLRKTTPVVDAVVPAAESTDKPVFS
jgi:hypothetical protein